MEIDEALVAKILTEIKLLEIEYQSNQAMILTEDDLKCNLFARLKPLMPSRMPTINKDNYGSPIHTEVKFYDEKGFLTLVPDITIVHPRHLSIFHSVEFKIEATRNRNFGKLPSKSFELGGHTIIIELKFCRNTKGIQDEEVNTYQADLDKISRLQNIVRARSNGNDRLYGIFAFFNKTDLGKEKFEQMVSANTNPSLHILYNSGKVDFGDVEISEYEPGYRMERHSHC
ncbi:hypothetical protein [Mucilaginibacter lappiensis]|uniref:hypothetical protein n=1 Tax=Mucilaginibacter lappiensis TaxID=354630 RepID=UPI003D262A35